MKTNHRMAIALAIATSPMACVGQDHHVEDEGKVCLYASSPASPGADDPVQDFVAGERLYASVQLDECLSACIRDEVSSCTITREGNELVVTSSFEYSDPDGEEACIALCYAPSAVCESEPLPEGSYTVRHGDVESGTLSIPAVGASPCFD